MSYVPPPAPPASQVHAPVPTYLAWAITVTPGTLVTVIGETDLWVHVVLGGPREEMIELLAETEKRTLSVLRGEK